MRKVLVLVITTVLLCLTTIPAAAIETAPRITDREIIESLSDIKGDIKGLKEKVRHLEDGQKAILREMDRRFSSMEESANKRFESMDKRFESMDKRFESMENSMNERFDSIENQIQNLVNIFVGIVLAFAGIVAVTIGFAIWDRRTALRPTLREISEVRQKENKIINALAQYAKSEPKMAEVLRSFGLL